MPNPMTSAPTKLRAISRKQAETALKTPPLPKSVPKEMRKEWAGLVKHLRERNMWTDQKAGVLEAYLLNLNAIRLAQTALIASNEDILEGAASTTIARHTGQLSKLASLLGLGAEKVEAPSASVEKKAIWS